MQLIDTKKEFFKNSLYEIIEKENLFYLIDNSNSSRIEIDETAVFILNNLPSSIENIYKFFQEKGIYVSLTLLEYYFYLFFKAGVISPTETENKKDRRKKKEEVICEYDRKISIVIVTYNGEKYIKELLSSIRNQTYKNYEVIIVDNNSWDKTLSIIDQEKTSFNNFKVIINHKNTHFAKGVNIGVKVSDSELVVILNQDIILDNKFLERIVFHYEKYKKREKIGGLVPLVMFMRQKNFINSVGNYISNKGWGSDNFIGCLNVGQLKEIKYVNSAPFSAIVLIKNAFDEVGNLDEHYGSYYEDTDWCFRAYMGGYKLLFVKDAIAYHDFSGAYTSIGKLEFVIKNRIYFSIKNLSGRIRLGFLKRYIKEDFINFLGLLKTKNKAWAVFPKAYLRIFYISPLLLKLFIFNRKKKEDIISFFDTQLPFVKCTNLANEPVINKEIIRGYYYFVNVKGENE